MLRSHTIIDKEKISVLIKEGKKKYPFLTKLTLDERCQLFLGMMETNRKNPTHFESIIAASVLEDKIMA